jgi:hypothetical protein
MKLTNPKVSLTIMVIYFVYVLLKVFKIHPADHIPSLVMYIPWWFAIIMNALRFPISNMRKRIIQRKMTEICGDLNGYLFKSNVYTVLGDTNNVKEFIERIKQDGKIDDGNILDFDNIYVIDLAKQFNKETFTKKVDNSHQEVDPLGEEEWNDDAAPPVDRDIIDMNGRMLYHDLLLLEEEYGVKLRKITEVNDFYDAYDIKKATPRELEIKRARQEALRLRMEQQRQQDEIDRQRYHQMRMERDRDMGRYRNVPVLMRNAQGEWENPDQDQDDEDKDNEIPKNRRKYVVPGFDINPIQAVDRD